MRRLVISSDRNPVVHLELHTGDLAGARALYSQLCGWPHSLVRDRCGTYLALALGGGLGGGIVECPTRRAVWLPYVEVSDIERATEQAPRELAAAVDHDLPVDLALERGHILLEVAAEHGRVAP